jgi:tripartite-type tricarboxylate transporter receptor subunit TctC
VQFVSILYVIIFYQIGGGKMKRKTNLVFVLFLEAVLFALSFNMAQAAFPERPITLIIAFGPGGATDLTARALAKALEKKLGQPVICMNKIGAGAAVAVSALATAKPDGYTVGTTLSAPALTPHTMDVPYDVESFDYIILNGKYMYGVAVKSDSPFKTLKDLVDYAKQNPGKLKYSSSGPATPNNLAMLLLGKTTGVKWDNVSFKSGADAAMAALGGHVDATSVNPVDVVSLVGAGRMRLLASLSDTRWKWVPDVPTAKESGYDVEMSGWMGFGAPKGVPKPILDRLREAFKEASQDPEFLHNLEKFYMIPDYKSGEDYKKVLREDSKMNEKLLMEFGLHKSQKK